LVHFDRVRKKLRARQVKFRALPSASYATALFALVEAETRKVDEMLICALIEARSHERFLRLEAAVADEKLAALYRELGEAEARHGDLYVALAEEAARGDSDLVARRLAALTCREAEIVARPSQPVRMHSGG
jgi:tRNA-(ms[2]io[6]A)-hydroxylase